MNALKVVLADDHPLVRAGVRTLLHRPGSLEVVGEASSGPEALELVARLRPHLAVLDVVLPGLDGIEVCERIRRAHPRTRVVILSMHSDQAYADRARQAGASAYVVKEAAPTELEDAIRRAAAEVDPRFELPSPDDPGPLVRLSPRQREILRRLAEGTSMKEIALALGISVKTVEAHRAEMVRRVGIADLPGLVRLAIRTGLVDPAR